MGWTYTHKGKGTTVKEFLEERLNWEHGRILDCAVVGMRTAYIAYEDSRPNEPRKVAGVVVLLGYDNKSYYNFGYKDMDETMGPCECECPERILKQLSPLDESSSSKGYAKEWRKKCWENIQAKKSRIPLTKGLKIRFERPIEFRTDLKLDTFVIYDAKKMLATSPQAYGMFKLNRHLLNSISWSVVTQAAK